MSTSSTDHTTHIFENPRTDYSLSSLLGLPIHIITFLFFMAVASVQMANIHLVELLQGDFHIHGDATLLYFSIFLISATILLVVQYHLQEEEEEPEEIDFIS